MKKLSVILFLVSIVISNLSAQDKEWSDTYDFEVTILNDSTILNIFGSRTVYADNGDGIYHNMFISGEEKENIISGEILKYNYSKSTVSLVEGDSSITQFDVEFQWVCNFENGMKDTATVIQRYFNSKYTGYSIKVEIVDFYNSASYISWGGKELYQQTKDDTKLSFPEVFKIKRIAKSANIEDDLKNPDEIITYAEWTDNGFYRYSVTGEKDSIIFKTKPFVENVSKSYDIVMYGKTENRKGFIYSNFYFHEEPYNYVSTLDMVPFPFDGIKTVTDDDGGIYLGENEY